MYSFKTGVIIFPAFGLVKIFVSNAGQKLNHVFYHKNFGIGNLIRA
jgi:hypothetical protein